MLPFINPTSKIWIFVQVTVQLMVSVFAFFLIRSIINSIVYRIGKPGPGFGMFDKNKVATVIFAFVLFFAQSNLKEKMKALIPKL
jgi:hypothetical protein